MAFTIKNDSNTNTNTTNPTWSSSHTVSVSSTAPISAWPTNPNFSSISGMVAANTVVDPKVDPARERKVKREKMATDLSTIMLDLAEITGEVSEMLEDLQALSSDEGDLSTALNNALFLLEEATKELKKVKSGSK